MLYRIQDKHIDLKRVTQAMQDAGRQINEAFDTYLKEELLHGRATTRVKSCLDDELEYDADTGNFRDRTNGCEFTDDDFATHAKTASARDVDTGSATLRRPVFTASLLHAESGAAWGSLLGSLIRLARVWIS